MLIWGVTDLHKDPLVLIDEFVSILMIWVVFFSTSILDRKLNTSVWNDFSSISLYPEWGE
jgi:hypothetical protein